MKPKERQQVTSVLQKSGLSAKFNDSNYITA
jgi:hypothetical protein